MSNRNVVNLDEIDAFVERVCQRTGLPLVREWLRSTYRKWMIKHAPRERVVPDPASDVLSLDGLMLRECETWRLLPYHGPRVEWMLDAMARGDTLLYVRCDPIAEHNAWLVIEWLNSLHGSVVFGRLSRISYPQALEAAQAWQERLSKRQTKEDKSGDTVTIHQFGDGFRIVELKTAQALVREGRMMGHCVAAYDEDLETGTRILSLRDPRNRPHCTMEVEDNAILQIKGKQNDAPVARYRPYVRQYVLGSRMRIDDEGENVGLFVAGGRICCDVNEYIAAWAHECGSVLWRTPKDEVAGSRVDTAPLRALAASTDELTDESRTRLLAVLSQDFQEGARYRCQFSLDIFGEPFSIVRVEYPFALAFLRKQGVFRTAELRNEVDRVIDFAIASFLSALDCHVNWFFCLTVEDERWRYGESSMDLLTVSGFDLRRIRHQRFTKIRTRLSDIRKEKGKLLDDFSIPEVRRRRWEQDWKRAQQILHARSKAFI